jgi:hypothetical protein
MFINETGNKINAQQINKFVKLQQIENLREKLHILSQVLRT